MPSKKARRTGAWLGIALIAAATIFVGNLLDTGQEQASGDYLTPASDLRDAHGLAVDAVDSSKVYIASHTGLYLLQNDKDLYLVGAGRDDYMGFSAHPSDPNIFFTSGHPTRGGNLGFQKSTDGGKTWQKVSAGLDGPVDFHAMAVDQTNPDIVYGVHRGRMQKSTDGGSSWGYIENPPGEIIQLQTGQAKNSVYAATDQGIQVSRDQGLSWESLSPALTSDIVVSLAINPSDEQELLLYSRGLGFAKSNDGGANWSPFNAPFSNDTVLFIAYDRNQTATIYTLTKALALYKSTDSGQTWNKVR